ncbi:MAG: 50S ribosomal protein L17 [Patescibacteria group bacterium]
MIHGNKLRKFNRERNQRRALLAGLARSLVLKERIKTTEAKAKSLRPYVEKLITQSKIGTLSSRKLLISKIGMDGAKKLMEVIGPKYKERKGGYLRITKVPRRVSDGSKIAVIEMV